MPPREQRGAPALARVGGPGGGAQEPAEAAGQLAAARSPGCCGADQPQTGGAHPPHIRPFIMPC